MHRQHTRIAMDVTMYTIYIHNQRKPYDAGRHNDISQLRSFGTIPNHIVAMDRCLFVAIVSFSLTQVKGDIGLAQRAATPGYRLDSESVCSYITSHVMHKSYIIIIIIINVMDKYNY